MYKVRGISNVCMILLISCSLCPRTYAQDKRPTSAGVSASGSTKQSSDDQQRIRDEARTNQARSIISQLSYDSKSVLNPVVRAKIRTLTAEAYWHFQPERARQILADEFSGLASIALKGNELDFGEQKAAVPTYKGRPLEQVRDQLRQELLAVASAHDTTFARGLVATTKKDDTEDEVLATAGRLAETDPESAARIIQESLKNGADDLLPFVLSRLRDTSPAEASALFNQALEAASLSGDLWQLQRLVPYILPTEMDRLVGGKHYLTDPQRMADASRLIEYAATVLYRRIQTQHPAEMSDDLRRREYYLWRNLESVFNDLKPDAAWLINTRLRQLSASLPSSVQRPAQGPWSDDRVKTLLASADASTGEKRDGYLESAAYGTWRLGQGDLDKTIAIAEQVADTDKRNLITGTIYFQAGLKYLRTEGPDYALDLARKINIAGPRTRLFLAIIGSLNAVKATDRTRLVREELLRWLLNSAKDSNTAWAVLDYLDASASDEAERNFAAFDLLIKVLNSPTLDSKGTVPNRIYWHPEFHNFTKSLMPLAKADFDRGMGMIQMLGNKEIGMQIQAAFCADFLKTQTQTRKPPSKTLASSEK